MSLKSLKYYIQKAVEHGELTYPQANYLIHHPRIARRWVYQDIGLKIGG